MGIEATAFAQFHFASALLWASFLCIYVELSWVLYITGEGSPSLTFAGLRAVKKSLLFISLSVETASDKWMSHISYKTAKVIIKMTSVNHSAIKIQYKNTVRSTF